MEIPRIEIGRDFPKIPQGLQGSFGSEKLVCLPGFMLGQLSHIVSVCFLDLKVKTQARLLQNLFYC